MGRERIPAARLSYGLFYKETRNARTALILRCISFPSIPEGCQYIARETCVWRHLQCWDVLTVFLFLRKAQISAKSSDVKFMLVSFNWEAVYLGSLEEWNNVETKLDMVVERFVSSEVGTYFIACIRWHEGINTVCCIQSGRPLGLLFSEED